MDYNPASFGGNHHIIVVVDYFMKWEDFMPAIKSNGETTAHLAFNQIITWFGILREMVMDHGMHFQNKMMAELSLKLGYKQEHSSSYYPYENGHIEAVNKSLKSILLQSIAQSETNWHIMLYPALWAYQTTVKTATGFFPYHLVHGVESILPIECKIPSLKLAIGLLPETSELEECLVHLEKPDEECRDALVSLEVNKHRIKAEYDKSFHPWKFSEGDLVLLYDQASELLEAGNFNPIWHGPYGVKRVLEKGASKLVYYEGTSLAKPRNGLYLKNYYA